jgi:hypothetical protein
MLSSLSLPGSSWLILGPLTVIVANLRNDVSNVTTSLTELSPDYEKVTIRNIGGTFVSIKTPVESAMSKLLTGERFGGPFRPLPPCKNASDGITFSSSLT